MPTPPKTAAAADRRVDRNVVEVFEDLRGQFAGGRQDERARRAPRLVEELVEDRQQEGRGLAAAGGGAGKHVSSGEGRADGIGLNGGRTREPEVLEGAREAGMQPEV